MEIVKILVQIVNVISALAVIVLVLLQHGKGADAGAAFGSGSSSASLFGAAGSGNFLTKMTWWLAIIFAATCLGLGYFFGMGASGKSGLGVMESVVPQQQPASSGIANVPAISAGVVASGVQTRSASDAKPQIPD